MTDATGVAARLLAIHDRIAAACERSERTAADIVVVGASKRQSGERLVAAWQAGLRVFGENHVQEAEHKRPLLPAEAQWHLLGPLQTNKIRRAIELFDVIHSVDRLKVARGIERHLEQTERTLTGFLEINLGDEPTKHGFLLASLDTELSALADLERLQIQGLMAIPPRSATPEGSRPWFRRLRELRDDILAAHRLRGFTGYLSMGMSGDYEVAIEEGATHVRIGTELFGERPR